ncbi:MAG: T9SS type A sorting domain-containing protein [Candidatus Cloacimonetes bacterium]|nr:T9SS type A sorting domain-containing protein [Candidatus Cloacimonadota bacterium]
MKKILIVLFLIISANFLFAELIVDIPFDLDIIGLSYAVNGPYEYTSDWITATNTGTETYTYTFEYSYENMPVGWSISVCDSTACFMPNYPAPVELGPDESEYIHVIINVISTGGFNFNMTFDEGDLTEPLSYDFTFNTLDNVGIDNESQITVSQIELFQNYPNPFNPQTTISFNLTAENAEKNTELIIYNIKGQKIRQYSIFNNQSSIIWNGKDENGNTVPSGMYFYKLISEGNSGRYTSTKKMILMK